MNDAISIGSIGCTKENNNHDLAKSFLINNGVDLAKFEYKQLNRLDEMLQFGNEDRFEVVKCIIKLDKEIAYQILNNFYHCAIWNLDILNNIVENKMNESVMMFYFEMLKYDYTSVQDILILHNIIDRKNKENKSFYNGSYSWSIGYHTQLLDIDTIINLLNKSKNENEYYVLTNTLINNNAKKKLRELDYI